MKTSIDNSKLELNPHKVGAAFHGELNLRAFRARLEQQTELMDKIELAMNMKATATKSEYFTVFETESARKAKIAQWDSLISDLATQLIELSKKGVYDV